MSDVAEQVKEAMAVCICHGDNDNPVMEIRLNLVAELVAEVERLRSACKTLGGIVESQCQMVLNITGLHHLVDETGDGDWGLIWEKLAELGSGRLFDE
ncbi:hypothetical protein [Mycobacterium sp. 48b]|uniref:hypothetical protein n=1 Tax=Mycobacterium sp. 48b TaxID=3400426 RepID=UPI003AADF290